MADAPHFALPFRFRNGLAVVNEQDSVRDVADCVEAVLRTRPGQREEHPDFGVPDLAFSPRPLPVDALVGWVEAWEPRARLLAEERPDLFDEAVTRARLELTLED